MSNDRDDYRGNPLDLIETLANVAGGLGDWIANGTPASGSIAGEIQQRYRDHCDAWSNGPTWVQQVDPGARLFLSNACSPWLDSQGSGDPGLEVPFTGGQCPGVLYRIDWSSEWEFPNGFVDDADGFYVDVPGPISGVQTRQEGNELVRFVTDQNDNEYPFPGETNQSPNPNSNYVRYELDLQVTRQDGLADDCGSPPGTVVPNPNPRPDPGFDPEDEPFERAPGRPVLPMPRITDPFGDPVQLPNFPFPNVEGPTLYPEDDPILGGEPAEPGDKGEPDPPTETSPGGEEEETDSSRWLMGILVEVTDAPGRAPGFQTQAGFVYTEAGFVYQGAGDELEYYEESERLLSGGQYFPAVRGYDTWRVVANPFYRLRVTPFYKEKD